MEHKQKQIQESSVEKLLDFIITESARSPRTEYEMYFSGEYDSSQTKFEEMSNQLQIGVLAPNQKIAQNLLLILRIIIDNNLYLTTARMQSIIQEKWEAEELAKDIEDQAEEEPEYLYEDDYVISKMKDASIDELHEALIERDDYLSHFKLTEQPLKHLYGWNSGKAEEIIISPPVNEIMLLTVHDINKLFNVFKATHKPVIPVVESNYSLYEFMRIYTLNERKYPIILTDMHLK